MLHEICGSVSLIAPFDHVFSFTLNMFISGRTRARINGGEELGRQKREGEDYVENDRGRGAQTEKELRSERVGRKRV